MRKAFALLVLSSFVFANLSPAHAVTPRAGATCKKLGAKETFKGREFTCIKKGSKRVWNRGVVVRKPARPTISPTPRVTPSATPSPTPSPTPTASATPSATPTPTPSITPTPTPTPSPTPVQTVTPTPTSTPTPTPTPATTASTGGATREYTRAEVALRRTADSCWAIVNGNVYDLTRWIGRHPGGRDAILGICGVDGTEQFQNMHSTARPFAEIENYLIGKVVVTR